MLSGVGPATPTVTLCSPVALPRAGAVGFPTSSLLHFSLVYTSVHRLVPFSRWVGRSLAFGRASPVGRLEVVRAPPCCADLNYPCVQLVPAGTGFVDVDLRYCWSGAARYRPADISPRSLTLLFFWTTHTPSFPFFSRKVALFITFIYVYIRNVAQFNITPKRFYLFSVQDFF